jgi:hypothetical protein
MADKEYSQYDSFTVPGHWWLPGKTDRVAGELRYDAGDLTLRLFGAFHKTEGNTPFDHRPEELEVDVIHGESFSLKPITAFKAFYTSWRSSERDFWSTKPAEMNSSALRVHAVLIGKHLQNLQHQRYAKCRIQLHNLEGWLADSPFKHSDHTADGWNTQYVRPKIREYELPAPFNLLQIKSSTCGSSMPPMNRYEIVHQSNVFVEPSAPQPHQWYADVVGVLQQLLTLLAGKLMQTEREWLYADKDSNGSLLYYNRHNIDQKEDYGPIDFLFRYPDVEDYFSNILSVWLTKRDTIRHAVNLFFSSLREPGAFLETRFLPMVQVLEVYARADEQQTYIDPKQYAETRPRIESAIPTDIDKELRSAIIRKLEYANEYSLRTRLRRLVETLQPETAKLFCKDAKAFVGGVVDTRNYLTHYSMDSGRVLQGMDLHWATVKLQTMFSLILLKWIGLPETLIRERAQADYALGREREQWATARESGIFNV